MVVVVAASSRLAIPSPRLHDAATHIHNRLIWVFPPLFLSGVLFAILKQWNVLSNGQDGKMSAARGFLRAGDAAEEPDCCGVRVLQMHRAPASETYASISDALDMRECNSDTKRIYMRMALSVILTLHILASFWSLWTRTGSPARILLFICEGHQCSGGDLTPPLLNAFVFSCLASHPSSSFAPLLAGPSASRREAVAPSAHTSPLIRRPLTRETRWWRIVEDTDSDIDKLEGLRGWRLETIVILIPPFLLTRLPGPQPTAKENDLSPLLGRAQGLL
ncbi:hypothetical protein K438DRAFT_1989283 [Mycena galopus ATCC 62051]|nr:hypothetical protein K438DRAFT_1989283 [Mycena galopus ATCC 62051]